MTLIADFFATAVSAIWQEVTAVPASSRKPKHRTAIRSRAEGRSKLC